MTPGGIDRTCKPQGCLYTAPAQLPEALSPGMFHLNVLEQGPRSTEIFILSIDPPQKHSPSFRPCTLSL